MIESTKIDIRQQLIRERTLHGSLLGEEQPVDIQRAAILKEQVYNKYKLQIKFRIKERFMIDSNEIDCIYVHGELQNGSYETVSRFSKTYKIKEQNKFIGAQELIDIQLKSSEDIEFIHIQKLQYRLKNNIKNVVIADIDQSNGLIYVERTQIKPKDNIENEIQFIPYEDGNQWVCCCGTCNIATDNCEKCGLTLEEAKQAQSVESIKTIENRIITYREVEKQQNKLQRYKKYVSAQYIISSLLCIATLMFDRVPIVFRISTYNMWNVVAEVIIGLTLHIVLLAQNNKKTSSKIKHIETYGLWMQIYVIASSIFEIAYIVIGRVAQAYYFDIVAYLVTIVVMAYTIKCALKPSKHVQIGIVIQTAIMFIQMLPAWAIISDYCNNSYLEQIEIVAAYGQIIIHIVKVTQIQLIQFLNIGQNQNKPKEFSGVFGRTPGRTN